MALPFIEGRVRCPRGSAKITGPKHYGSLRVPYVIHAVGPNYNHTPNPEKGDAILKSAYQEALRRAQEHQLEAVAFPLLSCGKFRGYRSLQEVLRVGIQAILEFEGYPELKKIYLFAFNDDEFRTLQTVTSDLCLTKTSETYSIPADKISEEEILQLQVIQILFCCRCCWRMNL